MTKRSIAIVVLCGILGVGLAGIALANTAVGDDVPAMMVSPSTVVLGKVFTVTVHTNIPASPVVPDSLDLSGAAPTAVYADNLGHLAAKFAVDDLGLSPGRATLTLTGFFEDGTDFSAEDDVTVK